MKKCSSCKEIKEFSSFNKNKSQSDGLNTFCRECSKAKNREYYALNKKRQIKQILAARAKRVKENQKRLYNFLLKNPCVHCNESNPIVLEFDHIHLKDKNISSMLREGYSWKSIKSEISKCQVLCANCHRIKTAKDYNWYSYRLYIQN